MSAKAASKGGSGDPIADLEKKYEDEMDVDSQIPREVTDHFGPEFSKVLYDKENLNKPIPTIEVRLASSARL
jgi:hypothetical protein